PSVLIDAAISKDLEILAGAEFGRLGVEQDIQKAAPLHWRLRRAVDAARLGYARRRQDCRRHVDDMRELQSRFPVVTKAGRPAHDHWIAGSTKVAGDLLRPLERRVHGMGPGRRKMIEMLFRADLVDMAQYLIVGHLVAIEEGVLVERAVQATFRRGTVVT